MKLKRKFGMGVKKSKTSKKGKNMKKKSLKTIIKLASKSMIPSNNARDFIDTALEAARKAVKQAGGKGKVTIPRVLPIASKVGGFLPMLIPLFAGLSATGALAGGAAGVAKAVNDAKAAQRQLEENQRHNRAMETMAVGKGLYLKPHKTGLGLHLKPAGRGLRKKKKVRSKSA